ncbi:TLC domain-containing protein [Xylariaceae sp. FL1019]|nr:TLC domain-containing protein [Xylariaceae sp. FL1019]
MKSHRSLDPSIDQVKPTIAKKGRQLHSLAVSRRNAATKDSLASSSSSASRPRRKRKSSKQNAIIRVIRQRTWTLPLLLTLPFLCLYTLNPTDTNIAHPFIFPSYKIPSPSDSPITYGKGPLDILFVGFYVLVLSFTREFIMHELLHPLAISLGIPPTAKSKLARFKEQMYAAVYTGFSSPLGMYVMYKSPTWYFDTKGMYKGYPHKSHEGVMKFYYLLQAAFWVQQALVMLLGLEKRRKDFKELVVHHVVTVSLIALSYRFHFTMMGCLVYVTHDLSDFFLATSKSLNYIDHYLQGPYFALCISVWVYLRHYINLKILYSITNEFKSIGPFILNWEAEQYKCELSQVITFSLLAALQALNLFWLYCLLRSAYKFVWLGIAKDDREDDDDDDEQPEKKEQ